jgi:hypothetical protein
MGLRRSHLVASAGAAVGQFVVVSSSSCRCRCRGGFDTLNVCCAWRRIADSPPRCCHSYASVAGGYMCDARGFASTVGGGQQNTASGWCVKTTRRDAPRVCGRFLSGLLGNALPTTSVQCMKLVAPHLYHALDPAGQVRRAIAVRITTQWLALSFPLPPPPPHRHRRRRRRCRRRHRPHCHWWC